MWGEIDKLVKLAPQLIEARFLVRLNRFAALVELDGREVMVHVANSGRMHELLEPGRRMLLAPMPGEHRKTQYDLALVDLESTLVSADSRLPNALVAEALEEGLLPQFADYPQLRREVTYGDSRLDIMLSGPTGRAYVETKSVTLVVDGVARFPDAPTLRGVKHLNTLSQAVAADHRGAATFVIQRSDASSFSPHVTADPEFGAALQAAHAVGVEIYAYCCRVSESEIKLADRLPVNLGRS